jgi:PIN domain nuclease of toxin-antitoxin system
MSAAGVADTHTTLWYLFGDPRLSAQAKQFIDQAAADRRSIEVSPISLAEIVYLVEKGRITATALEDVRKALDDPDHVFREAPFTKDVVNAMRKVARDEVPDMPDRIVSATAVYFAVPVISRDGKIRASNVQTIW